MAARLRDLRRALLRRLVARPRLRSLRPASLPRPSATPSSRKPGRSTIAPIAYGADTGRRMAPTDAVEALAESPERPIIDLRATFGRGDSFAGLLERAGVGERRGAGRRRA